MLKQILFIVTFVQLSFLVFSTEKSSVERLRRDLQKVIFHVDPSANVGVKVYSLDQKEVLFEKLADKLFVPGGILKLITAAAALDILGPSYCFETRLFSSAVAEKGVLKGNLYLEGSGDPSLSQDGLEDLVFQLKLMNVHEIGGDVVFDISEFDELPLAPGWMWDEKIQYRDGPVSALTINHSCINVWVRPSEKVSISPRVQIFPEIPGIIIENEAVMESIPLAKRSLVVAKKSTSEKDIIHISGVMPLRDETQKFKIPVKDPHLFVATKFCEILRKNNIKFKGKIRFDTVPTKCDVLASWLSEPLSSLVAYMLKNRDNLYANCFLKKIGRTKFGKPGTWPNGAQALRDFLAQITPENYSNLAILDGSGESRYNKISPDQMIHFMRWVKDKFVYAPEVLTSLPIAGVDYAFRRRLREKKFHAKLRAATGALQNATSICGYITTIDNEQLVFAIFSNGFVKSHKEIKSEIEDKVCHILSDFSREGS